MIDHMKGRITMSEQYYTAAQAAKLLDLHVKTIQRYIREGQLKAKKVGKEWRISGHDLSVFAEGDTPAGEPAAEARWQPTAQGPDRARVSSVIDVEVTGKTEAMRIMNTLVAFMNGRPPEYGQASLSTQYIEQEHSVRLIFWGGLLVAEHLLNAINMLVDDANNLEEGT
jgi:excisionase family DNA binding protein